MKRFFLAALVAALPLVPIACGARTPLLVPEIVDAEAGIDVRRDARRDAIIDMGIPPIDAMPHDANRNDCPDAAATLVYVVSEENDLLSFYPPTATFTSIGKIACPAPMGTNPFSMGVDRKGVAYVAFSDPQTMPQSFAGLFRVSTATAACLATPFKSDTTLFPPGGLFGMGYSTEGAGPAENLYIIAEPGVLGKVDFVNNKPIKIGDTKPSITNSELTGTGDGRLFAFYVDDNLTTHIGELDKTNANVIGSDPLPNVDMGTAWAFAFWGGAFYTFTAPNNGSTVVDRYDPIMKKVTRVGQYGGHIVGAGVSTCAPAQ